MACLVGFWGVWERGEALVQQPGEARLGELLSSVLPSPSEHMIYLKELDTGTGLQLETLMFGFESNLRALIVLKVPESKSLYFPTEELFLSKFLIVGLLLEII